MSRDVVHGSELHYGVVFLIPIKVIIPSHIGHAVMVQEGRHLVCAAASDTPLTLQTHTIMLLASRQ